MENQFVHADRSLRGGGGGGGEDEEVYFKVMLSLEDCHSSEDTNHALCFPLCLPQITSCRLRDREPCAIHAREQYICNLHHFSSSTFLLMDFIWTVPFCLVKTCVCTAELTNSERSLSEFTIYVMY